MKTARFLTHAAAIAAVYVALTHAQNMLLPGSASWAIQVRLSEAMCVLAFFTPAAIPGLSLGCLLFNLTSGAALPLDFLIGTLATFLAALSMHGCRRVTLRGYPILGMLMPVVYNALLVGWELWFTLGSPFWLNALYVAAGEAIALFVPGSVVYFALKRHRFAPY